MEDFKLEATKKPSNSKGILSIICCVIALVCVGVVYIWSVMKGAAMEYYLWEEGPVNLISNFMLFGFCIGSFVGGFINDKISSKITAIIGIIMFGFGFYLSSLIKPGSSIILFYITYCALSGIGSGFTFSAGLSCVQKWLPHRRGLASGLGTAGFALGSVIFGPVISAMLKSMNLSNALRILAISTLVVGIIACLLMKMPSKEYLDSLPKIEAKATSIASSKDYTFVEAIKTPTYWVFILSIFFYNATWNMLTPLIKGLGVDRGLPDAVAVVCVSLTGIFNACGRFSMSALSDKIGRMAAYKVLAIGTALFSALLTFVPGGVYFAVVLLTAFFFGGPAAVNPATCTDLFGQKYSATNYGCTLLALGFSSIAFGELSNVLHRATDSYTATFIVGCVTALITLVLYFILAKMIKNKNLAEQKEA